MRLIYLCCILLILSAKGFAQNFLPTLEAFGKNRIQTRSYSWQLITTGNFEVYFHGDNRQLAIYTAQLAETEFDRMTDLLSYTPYGRTKIFLYDSPNDLKQSNIGLTLPQGTDFEQENLSKSRILLDFDGNHLAYRKHLIGQIAGVFVYDMLYGGSLKESIQSQLLLSLPEWYISGITAYISEGWSTELDDYMRDVARRKAFPKPNQVEGKEAAIIGQSLWNFIAERFGRDNIANIVNLTRIIRTEETSISSTLGMPYSRFINDWKNFYTQMATQADAGTSAGGFTKIKIAKTNTVINDIKLSPSRRELALVTSINGRFQVQLLDIQTQKRIDLLKGGDRFITRTVNLPAPKLAWQDNGNLNVLVEDGLLRASLYQYEPSGKGLRLKLRRVIRGFNQVSAFDISEDGTTLILSADKKGQNDLFLYALGRAASQALTNDVYDDLAPSFVGKSSSEVVFTSNRTSDTLAVRTGRPVEENYRLFIHDGNPKSLTVTSLSEATGTVANPLARQAEGFFFLFDEKGIQNLYTVDSARGEYRQLTAFRQNIRQYDIQKKALAFHFIENGEQFVGFIPNINTDQNLTPTATQRKTRQGNGLPDEVLPLPSSLAPSRGRLTLRPGEIDTDNYTFGNDLPKFVERTNTPKTISNRKVNRTVVRREGNQLRGPLPFKDAFSVNHTENQFMVMPYLLDGSGFGWQNTVSINDRLEHNVITAGLFITPTFRNSEIFAEYAYLPKRIDFKVRYDRRTFSSGSLAGILFQKYRFNRLTATASYPINEAFRVSLSPVATYSRRIDASQGSLGLADKVSSFVGGQAEVVFDNTRQLGPNIPIGTKFKVQFQHHQGLQFSQESFNKLNMDFRHYTRVYRDLVLATRASFGYSAGAAPKQYILGGMDNWLPFSDVRDNTRRDTPLTPTNEDYSELLYTDFVTPLRGFKMNKISGNSFLLFNAEVRMPLVKVLRRGPITSNFLRSLQLATFFDMGTAWQGTALLTRRNSLNTQEIAPPGNVFRATVTNFKSPFLMGYGVGLRTLLLGYFVKGDIAWGIEDNEVQQPMFHFTLGYDF